MDGGPISVTRRGPVLVVRMDDGENRINDRWAEAMDTALDEVDAAEDPLALVTVGTGRYYSNGLDLAWLYGKGDEVMRSFVAAVEHLYARLIEAPYVTVAACNGHTYAAGAMLALCHDFRVMRADRGYFCLPEVDLGIPLTAGMDALMKHRLPPLTAHEVMVTGKRYGGTEAAAKQIVHEAVSEAEVLPRAIEMATEHAGKNRETLRAIKRRMYGTLLDLLRTGGGTAPA